MSARGCYERLLELYPADGQDVAAKLERDTDALVPRRYALARCRVRNALADDPRASNSPADPHDAYCRGSAVIKP